MNRRFREQTGRGMILLEVLLAVAIFGMAAVALVQLISQIAETSLESQFEMRVMNRMESLLDESSKAPNFRPGASEVPADAWGVSYLVEVKSVALRSSQGLPLNDLYRVQVIARWNDGAKPRELRAENFRYGPMYQ